MNNNVANYDLTLKDNLKAKVKEGFDGVCQMWHTASYTIAIIIIIVVIVVLIYWLCYANTCDCQYYDAKLKYYSWIQEQK